MPRPIPGYYYDEEKKKYFKVLPHHVAPAGAAYSKENVKKQAQDSKRKREANQDRSTRPRVQRSRVLQHALAGRVGLERELGQAPRFDASRSGAGEAYASGLEGRHLLELEGSEDEITTFTRDPLTGGIFAGVKNSSTFSLVSAVPRTEASASPARLRTVFAPQSAVTSVNIGPTRTLVSTCLGDRSEATINLTKLVGPDQIVDNWLDVGVHVILRPHARTSVWTSACAPRSGTIAVGTGAGVILIHETPSAFAPQPASLGSLSDWANRSIPAPSDVLAIEFLTDAVFLAGMRDGAVESLDTREPRKRALAIRHPSAVTHVRRVDEHRVVVNGLESSLRLYDLRYAHPPSPRPAYLFPTQPVLVYEHVNEYQVSLGCDVDADTGLLAAGREDGSVQLFGLHTARKVRAVRGARAGLPSCVHFSPATGAGQSGLGADERGPKGLFVGSGPAVQEFEW
ncbi:MAG: hypothetical protein M1832_002561 [Thelocarpon impressellum]|nr:MAG: hypothetical protein M1832_002561 [Thelocarpon impressellum]